MFDKDRVIAATGYITEALHVLCRINYANASQCERNMRMASQMLHSAANVLETERVKQEG